jgi:hypothetical protein
VLSDKLADELGADALPVKPVAAVTWTDAGCMRCWRN